MGKINRLKNITRAKIEAFLSHFETPETVLPQLARELAYNLEQAFHGEAKALTAVKADQRRLDAVTGRVNRYKEGALLAIKAGQDDLARQAVAAQIEAEGELARVQKVLETSENAYESAKTVHRQILQSIIELKHNKDAMLERSRQLRLRQAINAVDADFSANARNILETVAKMETEIEQAEAENDIRDEINRKLGLGFQHERVKELETNEEVDQRLKKIKEQIETRRNQ